MTCSVSHGELDSRGSGPCVWGFGARLSGLHAPGVVSVTDLTLGCQHVFRVCPRLKGSAVSDVFMFFKNENILPAFKEQFTV